MFEPYPKYRNGSPSSLCTSCIPFSVILQLVPSAKRRTFHHGESLRTPLYLRAAEGALRKTYIYALMTADGWISTNYASSRGNDDAMRSPRHICERLKPFRTANGVRGHERASAVGAAHAATSASPKSSREVAGSVRPAAFYTGSRTFGGPRNDFAANLIQIAVSDGSTLGGLTQFGFASSATGP
jgi:hypothetical protein